MQSPRDMFASSGPPTDPYASNFMVPDIDDSLFQTGMYQDFFPHSDPSSFYTPPDLERSDSSFTQTPTPLTSNYTTPSPEDTEEQTILSVSTAFFPGSHPIEPDITFSSSDGVLFYVHSEIISAVGKNAFASFIGTDPSSKQYKDMIINIPDVSAVLNVILHTLYGISCAQHSPTFETLVTAVDRMPFYGITPKDHILPKTPLYTLLLSYAPLYPFDLYALAGHHDLYDMAVHTSSHLLSFPLSNITDTMAERVGAIYLKRLMLLHVGRFNALKKILLAPPRPHPPTKECSFSEQKRLTRAWALVSAYLAWDARVDLSTHSMQGALNPLMEQLSCELCHKQLKHRIKEVVVQWASVERTI